MTGASGLEEAKVDPMPVNVSFSPKILPHGEVARMVLTQNDQTIMLTYDQAQTLAATITGKLRGMA